MKSRILTRSEILNIIRRYHISIDTFTLDEFGKLNVTGNVKICDTKLKKLPLKFGKVSGDFHCHLNKLTTLKYAPQTVGGDFNCSNNKLKSLKYAPKEVGGDFFCQENELEKLNGAPAIINGNFNCFINNLTSLKNGPIEVKKSYYAYCNHLISLEGSPRGVGKSFHVGDNYLIDLSGLPLAIGEILSFDNTISSISTGQTNCNVKRVEIQQQDVGVDETKTLPKILVEHQNSLHTVFKYQSYLDIYNEDNSFNIENFYCIIQEIQDGLR